MVQVRLAENAAQRRLSDQRGRAYKIDGFDDGFARVHDPEVHHRIHLDRDVVTGDGLLRWNFQRHNAQVHLAHGFDERDEEKEARSACRDQTPKAEDHAAFVLLHNLDRGADEHKEDDGDGANDHEHCHGHSLPCQMARRTGQPRSSSPSSTGASGWNGCLLTTDTRSSATWIAQRAIPLPGYNQRAASTPALISTAAGHSSRNAPSGTAMRPGASIGCVDPSR